MITLDGVSVAINGTPILRDISLLVKRCETVVIVGESGSGKTTLLHAVAGLRSVHKGQVEIDGRRPKEYRNRGRLGFLFQRPVLSDWLTVEENVALPLHIGRSFRPDADLADRAQVNRTLGLAHISHAANKYPSQLSGGMRARAALAAALVRNPEVLLADEPFSTLDDITRERVVVDVAPLIADATSLLVTHNLNEALLLANRIILLAGSNGGAAIVAEIQLDAPRPRGIEFLDSVEAIAAAKQLRHLLRKHATAGSPSDGDAL